MNDSYGFFAFFDKKRQFLIKYLRFCQNNTFNNEKNLEFLFKNEYYMKCPY